MQLILQDEAEQTLPRTITIPQGKAKIELHFEYQDLDLTQAATLIDEHDEAIKSTSENPTEAELAALRQGYLSEVLSTYLKKWDVLGIEAGKKTVLGINTTNIETVLKRGAVFWAIYNDWLDLITEISQGQSKTKRDAELKNLMSLGMFGQRKA